MATLARWARSFGLTRAICILLLLALVPLRIANPPPLEEIRLRTFDLYQTLRPREPGLRPVVIVDIDEASLKEIGQWPWPRTIVADRITRLAELGAVAIGFDVIFAEPDRMSPSIAAQSFRNLDDNIRDKLRNLPSNDEVLAQAIRRARDKLNQEFKREADQNGGKYMPLNVGIGLNTGPCVVGNMGSDFRFNYSVLGDTVNVASRLEARTKDYRVPIVIGAQTAS